MKFFRAPCGPNQNISICCSLQPGFYKHSFLLFQSMIYFGVIWLVHLETKKHSWRVSWIMSFKAPSKGKMKLQMLSKGDDLCCKLAGSQCELKPCLYSRMQMSLRQNHPKVRNNPSPSILDQEQCARDRWKGWWNQVHHSNYHSLYPIPMKPAWVVQGMWNPQRHKVNRPQTVDSYRGEAGSSWVAISSFLGLNQGGSRGVGREQWQVDSKTSSQVLMSHHLGILTVW